MPSPSRSPVHLPPRILDASFSKTFRLRLYIGQPETASSSSRSLITRVVQATGCCENKTANKSFEARCGKGALTNQLATNWGHRRFPHPHTTMACASAPNGSHDLSPRRSDPCNGFRRKVSYQPNRASEIRPTTRGGVHRGEQARRCYCGASLLENIDMTIVAIELPEDVFSALRRSPSEFGPGNALGRRHSLVFAWRDFPGEGSADRGP